MDRFANGSRAVAGRGGALTLEPSRPRAGIALGWVYVPLLVVVLAMAAAALGGCASQKAGPGVECDECAQAEVNPSALVPGGIAQAAAAEGGQRASNQPTQMDPGARGVHTVLSRGTGANTDSSTTTETRSQAGAPSVNQGLILPTSASNEAGGGPGLATQRAASIVSTLEGALAAALHPIPPEPYDSARVASILAALSDAQKALSAASSSDRPNVTNVYNLQGAVSNQVVANGSKSGGGDGDSISLPKTPTARAARAPGAPTVEQPEPAAPAQPAPGMQ